MYNFFNIFKKYKSDINYNKEEHFNMFYNIEDFEVSLIEDKEDNIKEYLDYYSYIFNSSCIDNELLFNLLNSASIEDYDTQIINNNKASKMNNSINNNNEKEEGEEDTYDYNKNTHYLDKEINNIQNSFNNEHKEKIHLSNAIFNEIQAIINNNQNKIMLKPYPIKLKINVKIDIEYSNKSNSNSLDFSFTFVYIPIISIIAVEIDNQKSNNNNNNNMNKNSSSTNDNKHNINFYLFDKTNVNINNEEVNKMLNYNIDNKINSLINSKVSNKDKRYKYVYFKDIQNDFNSNNNSVHNIFLNCLAKKIINENFISNNDTNNNFNTFLYISNVYSNYKQKTNVTSLCFVSKFINKLYLYNYISNTINLISTKKYIPTLILKKCLIINNNDNNYKNKYNYLKKFSFLENIDIDQINADILKDSKIKIKFNIIESLLETSQNEFIINLVDSNYNKSYNNNMFDKNYNNNNNNNNYNYSNLYRIEKVEDLNNGHIKYYRIPFIRYNKNSALYYKLIIKNNDITANCYIEIGNDYPSIFSTFFIVKLNINNNADSIYKKNNKLDFNIKYYESEIQNAINKSNLFNNNDNNIQINLIFYQIIELLSVFVTISKDIQEKLL